MVVVERLTELRWINRNSAPSGKDNPVIAERNLLKLIGTGRGRSYKEHSNSREAKSRKV